jgi:hypothetical protein
MSNPKEADKKTQLGLPPEVEAALNKRDAERQAAEATQIQQPALDLQRTLYGNPHDAPNRASAPRPQLPPNQAFMPPTPRSTGAAVAAPTARTAATSSPPLAATAPRGFVTTQRPPSAAPVSIPPSAPSPFERTTLGVPDATSRSVSVAPTRVSAPPTADGSIVRQVRVVGVGTPAPSASASESGPRTSQSAGRGLGAPPSSAGRAESAPSQPAGRGLGSAPVGSGTTTSSQIGRGIGAATQNPSRGISAPMQRIGVGSDGETRLAGSLSAEPPTRDPRELAPPHNTKEIVAPSQRELGAALPTASPAHARPNPSSPTAGYGENARNARPGLGFEQSQQAAGPGGSGATVASRALPSPHGTGATGAVPQPSAAGPGSATRASIGASSPKRPGTGAAVLSPQPSAAGPLPAAGASTHAAPPNAAPGGQSPSSIAATPAAARPSRSSIAATPAAGRPSRSSIAATPAAARPSRSSIAAMPAATRPSSGALNVSALAQRPDDDSLAAHGGAHGGASGSLLDTTEPDRDARERKPSPSPAQLRSPDSARAVEPVRGSGALVVPAPPPMAAGHSDPVSDALALGPGMQATRLVSMEVPRSAWYVRSSSAPASSDDGSSRSGIAGKPPLALHVAEPDRHSAPVRRWPALVLIGLAFVMFTGVIAVRAPALLPAPIARVAVALIASLGLAPHGNARPAPMAANEPDARANEQVGAAASAQANEPSVRNEPAPANEPSVRNEQAQADEPLVAGSVRNDQVGAVAPAQANDPAVAPAAQANEQLRAAPEAPSTFLAAVPTPSALQGASAELEKQAIDALLANDFASARGLYERLRVAEPTRPEYPLMLELLARDPQGSCGRADQPACAVP